MTVTEAIACRRVILDALEECRLAQAIWMAAQFADAIELANSFVSLTDEPIGSLVYTPRGLRPMRRFGRRRIANARDNQRAIQVAIDACVADGGGMIHIPRGAYAISQDTGI